MFISSWSRQVTSLLARKLQFSSTQVLYKKNLFPVLQHKQCRFFRLRNPASYFSENRKHCSSYAHLETFFKASAISRRSHSMLVSKRVRPRNVTKPSLVTLTIWWFSVCNEWFQQEAENQITKNIFPVQGRHMNDSLFVTTGPRRCSTKQVNGLPRNVGWGNWGIGRMRELL